AAQAAKRRTSPVLHADEDRERGGKYRGALAALRETARLSQRAGAEYRRSQHHGDEPVSLAPGARGVAAHQLHQPRLVVLSDRGRGRRCRALLASRQDRIPPACQESRWREQLLARQDVEALAPHEG